MTIVHILKAFISIFIILTTMLFHKFQKVPPISFFLNSRDAFQAVLPGGDVQRRVPVDVDRLQVAAGGQEQLGDLHAAGERRPVEADVLLLDDGKTHAHRQWRRRLDGRVKRVWSMCSVCEACV